MILPLSQVENIILQAVGSLAGSAPTRSMIEYLHEGYYKLGITVNKKKLETIKIVNVTTLLNNDIKSEYIKRIHECGYHIDKTELGVVNGRLSFFFTLINVAALSKTKLLPPPDGTKPVA